MSGRAQAANLTGMLSQLADSVGGMGEAQNYLAQNIRDYAAPDINDASFESLSEYADWAQRNGRQDVADKYRALALTQQEKSKKGAYAQGVASRQEKIRGLRTGLRNAQGALQRMPEQITTMVDAPTPKPDVGGARRPLQAADNGGFRRPPVAPQTPQQIEQQIANPQRAVLQKTIDQIQADLDANYASLNQYAQDNVQFGGVGNEGSVFERTLDAEEAAAMKARVAQEQALFNLDKSAGEAAVREATPGWQQAEAGFQDRLGTLIQEIDQLENIRADVSKDDPRYDAVTQMINSKRAQKDAIAAEYQEQGVRSIVGDGTESDTFIQQTQDRVNEERRAQAAERANRRIAMQAEAEIAGIVEGQRLAGLGYKELPAEIRAKMHPLSIVSAESTIESYRVSTDRIEKAFEDRYVTPEDVSYAANLGPANTLIDAALKAYQKELANPTTQGVLSTAAQNLTAAVEDHRRKQTDSREEILARQSIGEYARLFKSAESWTDSPFNDDVMDDITDDNREEFYASIEQVMVSRGVNQIKSPEEFFEYAVIARDKMGMNTDTANMAAVIDKVNTDQLVEASSESLFEQSLAKINAEDPELNASAANRKARDMADKLSSNFKILFMGQNADQIHWLSQPYSKEDPPWMHQLFDNDPASIKDAIEWLREDPNNTINYKMFKAITKGDTPDA